MTFLNGNIVYDKLYVLEDGRFILEKNDKGEFMDKEKLEKVALCCDLSQESCYEVIRLMEKILENYKTYRL